jgi:AAA15 family ATPase/GTPase
MTYFIDNISIEGIRGINNKFDLELSKGCNLLYGLNGAGKTSILQAIEWCFTGRISYSFAHEFKKADALLSHELPIHYKEGLAFNEDATKFLRTIDNDSTDLLLTSPPYLNKQTYAWDNRIRLWFLNYNYKDFKKTDDYLEVASRDRYLNYMKSCVNEMSRILKKDGQLIMILGDIHGLAEDVSEIIREQRSYAEPITIIEDSYANGRKSSVYSRKVSRMDKIIVAKKHS